jgi:hypothetical protein
MNYQESIMKQVAANTPELKLHVGKDVLMKMYDEGLLIYRCPSGQRLHIIKSVSKDDDCIVQSEQNRLGRL